MSKSENTNRIYDKSLKTSVPPSESGCRTTDGAAAPGVNGGSVT